MKTFAFFLILPFLCFASYTGNPASPALLSKGIFGMPNPLISLNTGYLFDFVEMRKLDSSRKPSEVNLKKVTDYQIEAHLGYACLTLLKRMELYAFLGLTQETMQWEPLTPSYSKLETKYHFTYAIGSKFILLDFGSAVLGLDVQYFTLPSSKKIQQRLQNLYQPLALNEQYLKWKEWHIALGFSTKLGPFSPYVGTKYSHGVLKVKTTGSLPSLRFTTPCNWGLFTGLSLNLTSSLYVSGEARFFDEEAFSAKITNSF